MITQQKLDEMEISSKIRISKKVEKMKQSFYERPGVSMNIGTPPPNIQPEVPQMEVPNA